MPRKKTRPRHISNILSELIARRGYGRVISGGDYEAAWRQAAGTLAAKYSRAGSLRRGTLEVVVSHSALMQELGFRRKELIEALNRELPDQKIRDIRFRSGPTK